MNFHQDIHLIRKRRRGQSFFKIAIIVYYLLALIASMQSFNPKPVYFEKDGLAYTSYNNYLIFKYSYFHLKDGKDLYRLYPKEHWDLYKYSPSFAVFFGFFSLLPDSLGLVLWNILNAGLLCLGVYYLPKFDLNQKSGMLIAMSADLLTSLQNSQSNGLILGLLILGFALLERRNYFLASFFIVATIYIKLFGLVALALGLFYPQKLKLAAYSIFHLLLLASLPLIFIDFSQYLFLLNQWKLQLLQEHSLAYGYSVMGWLKAWFQFDPNRLIVLSIGVFIFLLPYLNIKSYKDYAFRRLILASILIWVVIFNHKAESSTFIIAMGGVSLWFFTQPASGLNRILFTLVILLTSLASSDIYPEFFRQEFIYPFQLKVFPCILVWIMIIIQASIMPKRIPSKILRK